MFRAVARGGIIPTPVANESQKTILLIAGDLSGDINTARLARTVRERHPGWTLIAIGGEHLGGETRQSPGGQWLGDTRDMSGIGIYASVAKFPRAVVLSRRLKKFSAANKIDAVVMCDWGAFNCGHLNFFKKIAVPVLYYFPPGSWRRTGRGGLGIAPFVARVATPFEWSAQRLVATGCNAEWVGHPMLEKPRDPARRAELRREFGVAENEKLVALLPGSRMAEVKCLAPRLAAAAEIFREKKGVRFIVATPQNRLETARKFFPDRIKIVGERAAEALLACDAAVVKSGSATLEAAVLGAPQVVVYDFPWIGRIEWLFLWMWKKNVPFIAMPNVILQRMAVQELLGPGCTPAAIAKSVTALLEDEPLRARLARDCDEIRRALGSELGKPGSLRTAEILDEMLAQTPS
jgi:lipid-A-disaccharide synthase